MDVKNFPAQENNISKELHHQQQRYQKLMELSSEGIFIMDLDGKLLDCSLQAAKILGYSKEELLKLYVYDWDISHSKEEALIHVQNTPRETLSFETKHKRKDGSTYDASIQVVKIDIDGTDYIYASVRDITEQKKELLNTQIQNEKLATLATEQTSFLSLFDKGDAVLFKWKNNPTWDIEYVSQSVEKLLGYSVNDFMSNQTIYATLINEEDLKVITQQVERGVQNNLDFFKHTPYRLTTKNGEEKWILDYTVTQKDAHGNITHFIGYLSDITEQKNTQIELLKAKESAEKANKIKSEFLANMSHEIRTPLNGVIGLTELALKTELTEKQREYLEKSRNSSHSLLHVINDILDFSKMEAGKLTLEFKPFHLNEIVQSIQNTFDYLAQEKGLSFTLTYPHNLYINGDPLRLIQILTNIIGNAIKFTKEGAVSLVIETLKESDKSIKLRFRIKDTGIGIKKETQEKLFEAFAQADTSITRQFGGTGLGLTITKQLVDMMDGTISINSQENVGSEFVIEITFKKSSVESIHATMSSLEELDYEEFKNLHLLIVEDNKTNQLVIMGILEDYEMNLDFASNGEEGVAMVEKNDYALILMDIQMPVMDGIEATKRIKAKHPSLPIIALSAAVMKEDVEKAKQAGVDAYVSKPIDSNELLHVIQNTLKLA